MILKVLVVGPTATNCYLIGCSETLQGAVIDPGGEEERILRAVKESGLSVKYIINTHGHGDHILSNGPIKKATGAEVLIHENDAPCLTDNRRSLLTYMGTNSHSPAADRLLHEDDVLNVGNVHLKVLHTPGHTPGGISLLGDGFVFCGDTLFNGSIGRTDFPGGSFDLIIKSIRDKLLSLPDETNVYCGHGPETTIGAERQMNPYLQEDKTWR